MTNRFIVVSGLPASGKSTLAKSLAARLEIPVFDKDTFLEDIFDAHGPVSNQSQRRRFSKLADDKFQSAALKNGVALLVSWWRHPASTSDSGTPIEWLIPFADSTVEIHCSADVSVCVERFISRKRHSGHLDSLLKKQQLHDTLSYQHSLGALGFRKLIQVSTLVETDLEKVENEINKYF